MDSRLTPMMRQYLEIKKKYADEILFFRMGDFYEMFFDDAHSASRILDIALTSRQNDVPMCGIPYHAAESYIARLIKAGKRVAICEQMETVPTQGNIVRREVVRVITPGTVIESNLLPPDANNFLASIIVDKNGIGLAFVDISTGDFFLTRCSRSADAFRGELARYMPTEVVLCEGEQPDDSVFTEIIRSRDIPVYRINEWFYDIEYMKNLLCDTYRIAGINGLGFTDNLDIVTAGSLIQYLQDTQKRVIDHLKFPRMINTASRMVLDEATISNLELVTNSKDGTRNRTLYSVLNHACTAMGRRFLERSILEPLLDRDEIDKRLDRVQYFHEFFELSDRLREALKNIHDVERLVSRFTLARPFPRNFLALRQSLDASSRVRQLLLEQPEGLVHSMASAMTDLDDLAAAIDAAIDNDPAVSPEQGRVIRPGFNPELDHLYQIKNNGRDWVLQYQENEKKRLGINTLKVRYNKILGYYIEISKGQSSGVPAEYYRKQTLVGAERYTTDELQRFEEDILSSGGRIIEIEKAELEKLRTLVTQHSRDLQDLASIIGEIDYLISLAVASREFRYVRPVFGNDGLTSVRDGRHPVVERYYTREVFIPNDITLDNDSNIIKIITGPNMSGKSTYIRTCAIIQLMAQIGSFVPASEAELTIVDRIFTRIGASDNISRGESTFLVEMNETAGILNNATDKSLIIMDEVGRGTSTYDGLAIAWAIVEYILHYLHARTLFATHYHELTRLGDKKGIVNYTVLVREHMSGVDFLHRVVHGAADKSYGIHVAKLAGIPSRIINRSKEILEKLEKNSAIANRSRKEAESDTGQLEIFNAANHLVIQAIKGINTDEITPLDALNELNRLKKLID